MSPQQEKKKYQENRSILCIDDDQAICVLLQLLFQADFNVTVINDPFCALDAVKNQSFDLVITDLNMPEVSGIDIIRALRLAHPETPVAVASGSSDSDTNLRKAVEMGACAVFSKPFLKRAELCRAISNIITEKQVSYALSF